MVISEARKYIWYETSKGATSVGPAFLEQESSAAEKTHGDRVIGAALARYGAFYCFKSQPPERQPPRMSQAARMAEARRAKAPTRQVSLPSGGNVSRFLNRLRS